MLTSTRALAEMLILCLVAFLSVAVNLLDRLFHVGPGQTVDQDSLLILTVLKKKKKKTYCNLLALCGWRQTTLIFRM